MEIYLLLILIPVLIAAVAKYKFHHTFTWKEFAAQVISITLVLTGIWFTGTASQTLDFEIWNGEILEKKRKHGHYKEAYSCNCYRSCTGSGKSRSCHQVCRTCYRDHYTVDWYVNTTIGTIRLDYLERTSRSVYNTADPSIYVNAQVGGICSEEHSYTNYVKAVPDSLFSQHSDRELEEYATLIPAYPRVHSVYKVNRVLTAGVQGVNISAWNDYLGKYQKKLGNSHQVNIIVVIVNTADQMYRHALEKAWLGGKKNDVIVIMGVPDYPQIAWVDTITLGRNSGNELMSVMMRDTLMKLGTIENHIPAIDAVATTVREKFDRKPMADYDYLKDEIKPPTWVIIMAFFLSIGLSIGSTIYFHLHDPFNAVARRQARFKIQTKLPDNMLTRRNRK